ncbi:MAG: alpha/beta hydrolase [Gammaproteobacteria bacterium]|nr:alpha/beta hydrolase [Gammaproteobacteria bacterium]
MRFILLLAAALASGCAVQAQFEGPAQVLIPVYYATNRSPLPGEDDGPGLYGDDRGELSFGTALVALSTRKEGKSRFADWARWEARTGASRNRNELLAADRLEAEAFGDALDAASAAAGDRSVLLFVHGFRRSFEVVAKDVATVALEINIHGMPMFFSWPSANSVLGYAADINSMRWAAADLRDTLKFLLARESISTVHVIAHSLGGDGLLAALQDLSRDDAAYIDKLGEVVLASPDVDAGLFRRDYLPALQTLGARVTLYATDNDVPLRASERVNRYHRLGDAKAEIFTGNGVETIVYSDVVTFMNSHDAVVEIGDVQADMHYLLVEGRGANERPTLTGVDTDGGRYWRVRPVNDQDR